MAISNLQPQTTYAIHLRSNNSPTGKDWIGSFTAGGEIHAFWGKRGSIIQHAGKLGTRKELDKTIAEKMNGKDRYYEVDTFDSVNGWHSQLHETPDQPAPSSPPPKPLGTPVNIYIPVDASTGTSEHCAIAPLNWDF